MSNTSLTKSIIITGCSWSAGVWSNDHLSYRIIHGGISQMLTDHGYNVINLSQPGSDNWGLLSPLDAALRVNPHHNIVNVFFIQTDIIRSPSLQTPTNLRTLAISEINNLYIDLYTKLNQIGIENNMVIDLIGGLTDVTVDLTIFKHLNLACQSWSQLIDSTLPLTPVTDCRGLEEAIRYTNFLPKEKLTLLTESALARMDFIKDNQNWFYPDGKHPNKQAHQLLFEHIKKHVN